MAVFNSTRSGVIWSCKQCWTRGRSVCFILFSLSLMIYHQLLFSVYFLLHQILHDEYTIVIPSSLRRNPLRTPQLMVKFRRERMLRTRIYFWFFLFNDTLSLSWPKTENTYEKIVNILANITNHEGIAEVDTTERSPIATKVDYSTNNPKIGSQNHGWESALVHKWWDSVDSRSGSWFAPRVFETWNPGRRGT